MPVRGLPYDDVVADIRERDLRWLGGDVLWFDAHTHIGHADPDGYEADPHEIVEALDAAGQQRALLFAMQEPEGYPGPNDWVVRSCAESGGRLVPLWRVDPNATGALKEARRGLDAGARGFKLHPRSDAFGLPHPVVEQLVGLAAEQRLPVLFHAGRGIPDLGESVVDMAMAHPDARLILAHAGISDLGLLAPRIGALPNVLFDTSWWMVSDLLTLYTMVPPGQILYASDMPYGGPRWASMALLRCARAAGLTPEQTASMAGAQLQRIVDGEDLLDLGPAPGTTALGPRVLALERVIGYLAAAVQMTFRGGEPREVYALARLACQAPDGAPYHEALREIESYISLSEQRLDAGAEPYAVVHAAMTAMILAGTAAADGT